MFGVGNVCVSKDNEHAGIGAILMVAANAYLKRTKSCGLLLCHENTLDFYRKCGWQRLKPESSFVEETPYSHFIMVYDPKNLIPTNPRCFMIDKGF